MELWEAEAGPVVGPGDVDVDVEVGAARARLWLMQSSLGKYVCARDEERERRPGDWCVVAEKKGRTIEGME